MHYYRVISAWDFTTRDGQTVEYFTILPENKGIEERNVPVVCSREDLSNYKMLNVLKVMRGIYVHYDDKTYNYRSQAKKR